MASIHKRRNKYQVRVRRKGYPTISRTFLKLSDAKEWATLQERQADRGELGPNRKELERIILADLVIRYRDTVLPDKKAGYKEAEMLTAFLRHPICKKQLSELSATDFMKWKEERIKGKGYSKPITAKSAKRILSPVQRLLQVAMDEWGVPLRENPLSRFKFKVIDNKRQRRLLRGELDRLLKAGSKTRNPHILPIVLFALETAMRRGEILSLRVRDIDLERHSATVRDSKNGYSRTIPLSSVTVAVLTVAIGRMNDEDRHKNGRLFPVTPIALRLAWDRLRKRAGIDDLHFHDLRHEAISRLFELGLTVPEVASISGHRDMRMLFRYAHANLRQVSEKLNSGVSMTSLCASDYITLNDLN